MNTRHKTVMALSALLALSAALCSLTASAQQTWVRSTRQIVSVRWIQGQSQWRQAALNRIAGTRWQFNPSGTLIYSPANSRSDLFPLRGAYHKEGNAYVFSGSADSRIGYTGSAHAEIAGRLYQQNGEWRITMRQITTSGSAAHINDQNFVGGASTAYEFTVTLQ
jgi:hypothetical protein